MGKIMKRTSVAKSEVTTNESKEVNIMNNVTAEKKVKRVRREFADIMISKVDTKAKGLTEEVYKPIREQLYVLFQQLDNVLLEDKKNKKAVKTTFKRLAKFSKEDIEKYLKSLN